MAPVLVAISIVSSSCAVTQEVPQLVWPVEARALLVGPPLVVDSLSESVASVASLVGPVASIEPLEVPAAIAQLASFVAPLDFVARWQWASVVAVAQASQLAMEPFADHDLAVLESSVAQCPSNVDDFSFSSFCPFHLPLKLATLVAVAVEVLVHYLSEDLLARWCSRGVGVPWPHWLATVSSISFGVSLFAPLHFPNWVSNHMDYRQPVAANSFAMNSSSSFWPYEE